MESTLTPPVDWTAQLVEQLEWHWRGQLRPRLDGLTDDEYRWEPVAGCWSVRPRGTSTAPMAVGSGDFTIDVAVPEPDPAPVTTIAWRIGHLVVGVLGRRAASHFGGPPFDHATHEYPGAAATALARGPVGRPPDGAAARPLPLAGRHQLSSRSDAAAQQPGSFAARYPGTASSPMRSWLIESRSRTVTASSSRVSKSTVRQNGVPISSCRR
ncbi:MAG: hypothetical protein JWR62_1394 [Modestobacter sp.]|jgi:hypothetical protein|nr:hypothetical protein [Modestobacter sp.]